MRTPGMVDIFFLSVVRRRDVGRGVFEHITQAQFVDFPCV